MSGAVLLASRCQMAGDVQRSVLKIIVLGLLCCMCPGVADPIASANAESFDTRLRDQFRAGQPAAVEAAASACKGPNSHASWANCRPCPQFIGRTKHFQL